MPHGGARKGAGRKPKSLADKLADGNPGRRPLQKMEFPGDGVLQTEHPDYLPLLVKKTRGVSTPTEIYDETVKFLATTGCLNLISPHLIANYAAARYYLLSAQWELSTMLTVGHNEDKDEFYVTAFTDAMLKMQKNENECWDRIWDIVSANSEKRILNPEKDVIIGMAIDRQRKKPKGEPPNDYYGHPEDSGE